MAKQMQPRATDVLAELEALALRDLAHQTERMRAALARAAPSRGDAVEHGELSRARMGAQDALELYTRVHDAGRAAMAEAQEEEEEEETMVQVQAWPGADQRQRQADRRHWENEG